MQHIRSRRLLAGHCPAGNCTAKAVREISKVDLLKQILTRNNIPQPDGRPLFAYEPTADEMARLAKLLRFRVESGQRLVSTGQAFVLWASERIRTEFPGGKLSWDFVFGGLALPPLDLASTYWLVEKGLRSWGRSVRRFDQGSRAFLYTLLAEGGLPNAALQEASRYRSVLISLMAELEREGALASTVARSVAARHVQSLPQALRNSDQEELLSELVLVLIDLRRALPENLPRESAMSWLDANRLEWRNELPLRLSAEAIEGIVKPALTAERPRPASALAQRELRRDGAGVWHGVVHILEGALIPGEAMPEAQGKRLRLSSGDGATFIGQPEQGGWRLLHSAGKPIMALPPQNALLLKAYADGHQLGEIVLDSGMPAPNQASSLWRPRSIEEDSPEVLVPLSARGQTRTQRIWVLAENGVTPTPEEGLSLGPSEPGPGGCLWSVQGQGRLRIGEVSLALRTGAEADSPIPRILASGRILRGFTHSRGIPVYLGSPDIFGAEGERPLQKVSGQNLRLSSLQKVLFGEILEWVKDGFALAQLRMIVLPVEVTLSLNEVSSTQLRFQASGLSPGLHAAISAGNVCKKGIVSVDGRLDLDIQADDRPGLVSVRLWDPKTGGALELSALWPAKRPRIIDPDGRTIQEEQRISIRRLAGWRGYLPGKGGAALVRLPDQKKPVGFANQGEIAFSSLMPLIRQSLALTGADGRVKLRLAAGVETPRISIGRYDWDSHGPLDRLEVGRTALSAINLHDPAQVMRTKAEGYIDIVDWLGESEGLWFIQGESDLLGVMRPFVWSAQPIERRTRDERIAIHESNWTALIEKPADPGWESVWSLISTVRDEGDAGALDQVQALARTPAAAVALLMMAPRSDRAAALDLEIEAPFWWPLVTIHSWATGVTVAHQRLLGKLVMAGFTYAEASEYAADGMARVASELVTLRPELAAHVGIGLKSSGLSPKLTTENGGVDHLLPSATVAHVLLSGAAQDAARRFDSLPDGASGLNALRLDVPDGCNEVNAPLFHAPLVVAEVAAGLRPALEAPEILRLIALREADTVWFDRALPTALTLALSLPEVSQ